MILDSGYVSCRIESCSVSKPVFAVYGVFFLLCSWKLPVPSELFPQFLPTEPLNRGVKMHLQQFTRTYKSCKRQRLDFGPLEFSKLPSSPKELISKRKPAGADYIAAAGDLEAGGVYPELSGGPAGASAGRWRLLGRR